LHSASPSSKVIRSPRNSGSVAALLRPGETVLVILDSCHERAHVRPGSNFIRASSRQVPISSPRRHHGSGGRTSR
jgi:hypothetical protein